MGDEFFPLNNVGASVRRPITNAGYIPVNLRLDQENIDRRLDCNVQNTLYPSSKMSPMLFAALPREVALMTKAAMLPHGADGVVPAFTVLNAIGEGKTRRQVIEAHSFAGLVGSQGAVYDNTGSSPRWPDFSAKIGGIETIINTGTERIMNGERVYWDFPPEGSAQTGTRDGRILVAIRPYRPSVMQPTADAIKLAMCTERRQRRGVEATPISDATVAITNFSATLAVAALDMYLSSGLVRVDQVALGSGEAAIAARRQNAAEWAGVSADQRERHFVRVARALRVEGVSSDGGVAEIHIQRGDRRCKMSTYLAACVAGYNPCIRRTPGLNGIPSGDMGALLTAQLSSLESLLKGTERAGDYVKSRIFAKMLTPMNPGEAGDCNLGAYTV